MEYVLNTQFDHSDPLDHPHDVLVLRCKKTGKVKYEDMKKFPILTERSNYVLDVKRKMDLKR